ncbi:MAG TPA: bifunctional glycosyltransferase/class I SAM-dependent methyltransferase [Acidimicrobiia bacterium]|nr:bifunctional glycosyltransferase/class I SAM-dependent methyltransferase [Acidimicrobiia bacterium]
MKRIGILVVAYNAASTLARVLDRIPRDFVPRISEVLVCDDHSQDATYLVGLGYQRLSRELPLNVIRHDRNLGYGGNQKAGYRWAIEHGWDIAVMLHGDGQYAPEVLPQLVEPLELDKCDAVFGSRMMDPGAARRGGMPLYKYIGNKVLTAFENKAVGTDLSEWHSGYRAYSVRALEDIEFGANSNGFDFDTQIIVQLHDAGKQIVETPIPTYYGDEISYARGVAYARDVVATTLRYRLHKMGLGQRRGATEGDDASTDVGANAHARIAGWLAARQPARILDVGSSDEWLAGRLRLSGHDVTRVGRGDQPTLDLTSYIGQEFDVVVAADVLERVRDPEQLLRDARRCLRPGGTIVVSIPNFSHWYPRSRVALGRFDYRSEGALARDHVRFFTRASFERLAAKNGFTTRRRDAIGLPLDAVGSRGRPPPFARALERLNQLGVTVYPSLFAYHLLFELEPAPEVEPASAS